MSSEPQEPQRSTTAWIRDRFRKAAASAPAAKKDALPERIGDVRILSYVNRGSIGVVYRGQDARGRAVAVKVIRADQAGTDAEAVFRREADVLRSLQHPNIIALHDFGRDGAGLYLVMDFVDGPTFQVPLDEGAPREHLIPALVEVSRAVHYAHTKGIIHRDLKPRNILMGERGPVITDFGIARAMDAVTKTAAMAPIGTPTHMAPEQVDRKIARLGPATDIWALAVMLYQILCGRLPFVALDPTGMFPRILKEAPRPPRAVAPDVPEALERVCLKGLRKHPEERHASAEQFAGELAAAFTGRLDVKPAEMKWWRRLFGRS